MKYDITQFDELPEALSRHNIEEINGISFLPENIQEATNTSDFIYSETTTDIRKHFKSEEVINYLTDDKPLLRVRKSADWFGPTILIGYSVLTQNPHVIGITMNVLSNYLYDFFKVSISDKQVQLEIIVELKKKKDFQKIKYNGSIDGLKDLPNIIEQLKK